MNIFKTAKKSIILILLVSFFSESLSAQRVRTRSTDDRRQNTQVPVNQKFAFGANLGNFGFSNGGFSFSVKGMAGYKLADPFVAGITSKLFYEIISLQGPDINLFSYGAGIFGRVTILEQFFLQGEYDITRYESILANFSTFRDTYNYPMAGGGYESGYGPWKYGIMMLFNLKDEVRDVAGFGEYWITFSYNF